MNKLIIVVALIASWIAVCSCGCPTDPYVHTQVQNFVNWAKTKVVPSLVPQTLFLKHYACFKLDGSGTPPNGGSSKRFDKWYVSFIQFNVWDTERGRHPYAQVPFWAGLIDNVTSEYIVIDSGVHDVGHNIYVRISGLGKPYTPFPDISGAGFYVADETIDEIYPAPLAWYGEKIHVQSTVHKSLVMSGILGLPQNTTSGMHTYKMNMVFSKHDDFPLLRIDSMVELAPRLDTIQWLGFCSFGGCVNCPAGGACADGQ